MKEREKERVGGEDERDERKEENGGVKLKLILILY